MRDWTKPGWHTSSKSSGGNCVEVKREGDRVLVRDSKDRPGPVLAFDIDVFRAFIDGVKDGDLAPVDEGSG
jgi:Domain of unknown function (DUF397)